MIFSDEVSQQILAKLTHLYGDAAQTCFERLDEMADRFRAKASAAVPQRESLWDQSDVVLITYGDQIRDAGCTTLSALKCFLTDTHLDQSINTVHLLPCFPYSSDDGFSVIDYRQIDPSLGDWDDVADLRKSFDLMFDLVLNHCSSRSEWFAEYLKNHAPYDGYFIEADPAADLTNVTRPRSSPVLTPFETAGGTRHVWTTFSDDQIDLNFANPDVLIEMLDILLLYVANGARVVRLDAIAYLWKQIGTPCIHLSQTHAVVKLFRQVLDELAPGTIILTETNVPHAENVSYFGDGDEAQMVYQFSLSPLLLDAFLNGDATPLMQWLSNLEQSPPGTTYFNFTASHDGIGVRPLEGLVAPERLDRLIQAVEARGGMVSKKRNFDGTESPYELNITYFSALSDPNSTSPDLHAERFLASQSVMLALRGIPGIYFHSLVGTENDVAGFEQTGRARSLNRRKFDRGELDAILVDPVSARCRVFDGYRHLLKTRIAQSAFHPEASQQVIDVGNPAIIAFLRTSIEGEQTVLVLANTANTQSSANLQGQQLPQFQTDLMSGKGCIADQDSIILSPYQAAWLSTSKR